MKRLLLPLLAAIALPTAVEAFPFGKYPSSMEAYQACQKARKKGADQLCQQDYGTTQILLIKNYWCQNKPKRLLKKKCGPKKVIKRFKF